MISGAFSEAISLAGKNREAIIAPAAAVTSGLVMASRDSTLFSITLEAEPTQLSSGSTDAPPHFFRSAVLVVARSRARRALCKHTRGLSAGRRTQYYSRHLLIAPRNFLILQVPRGFVGSPGDAATRLFKAPTTFFFFFLYFFCEFLIHLISGNLDLFQVSI